MPVLLQIGSIGADVERLEVRLRELNLYSGVIDCIFGGAVESAVKAFQKSRGLTPDGVVGDQTWAALFPDSGPGIALPVNPLPVNPLDGAPLIHRCLALTGTFETSTPAPDCYSGLGGDFDGQGLSFGVLQVEYRSGNFATLVARDAVETKRL